MQVGFMEREGAGEWWRKEAATGSVPGVSVGEWPAQAQSSLHKSWVHPTRNKTGRSLKFKYSS